jgi:hypothetical protein
LTSNEKTQRTALRDSIERVEALLERVISMQNLDNAISPQSREVECITGWIVEIPSMHSNGYMRTETALDVVNALLNICDRLITERMKQFTN